MQTDNSLPAFWFRSAVGHRHFNRPGRFSMDEIQTVPLPFPMLLDKAGRPGARTILRASQSVARGLMIFCRICRPAALYQ